MTRRLSQSQVQGLQKTRSDLTNGSTIGAFPNNPNTIRGPSLNLVYCGKMGFITDHKELYDATLFTLAATDGTFIVSSTPGSRDSCST